MQGSGSRFQYHILTLVTMFFIWTWMILKENSPKLPLTDLFPLISGKSRPCSGRLESVIIGKRSRKIWKRSRKVIVKVLPSAFLNALLTWFCDNVYGEFWTSKLSLWLSHLLPPTDRRFRLRKFCTNSESSDSKSPSWFPQRGCSTRWRVCSSSLPVWARPESCWSWIIADLNCLKKIF